MSLPEDQENVLSQKMSRISIESNICPLINWDDVIWTKHRESVRTHMAILKAKMKQLKFPNRSLREMASYREHQRQKMLQLLYFQTFVEVAKWHEPCQYCKIYHSNEQFKKGEADTNTHNKWIRYNLGRHRIEAAKAEREREIWKRRNIEETISDNLPTEMPQHLFYKFEEFQSSNCSQRCEQQPLPESMIVDDKDSSLSETDSITSTLSSNSD